MLGFDCDSRMMGVFVLTVVRTQNKILNGFDMDADRAFLQFVQNGLQVLASGNRFAGGSI